ncbi:hypothetical protein PJI17_32255, partial [Mycobacterium kansasii]
GVPLEGDKGKNGETPTSTHSQGDTSPSSAQQHKGQKPPIHWLDKGKWPALDWTDVKIPSREEPEEPEELQLPGAEIESNSESEP